MLDGITRERPGLARCAGKMDRVGTASEMVEKMMRAEHSCTPVIEFDQAARWCRGTEGRAREDERPTTGYKSGQTARRHGQIRVRAQLSKLRWVA